NVITALKIHGKLSRKSANDPASILVSTVNGLSWREVWRGDSNGEQTIDQRLVKEVNGAYEVLVKFSGADELRDLDFETATKSHIDFQHSFDGGKTWTRSYSLKDTAQPWDVIHYETVESIPPGTRSVLCKYSLESSASGTDACSLYAVRMEVNHKASDATFHP